MLVIEGSIVQGCPQKLLDIRDALGNYWPFTSEINYPYMRKSIIYIQYSHDSIWLIHGHIWTHWVHCFIDINIYALIMKNPEVSTHSITNPALPPAPPLATFGPLRTMLWHCRLRAPPALGPMSWSFEKITFQISLVPPCLVHIDRKSETC